jgi:nicotinamide-nucleotide amidase
MGKDKPIASRKEIKGDLDLIKEFCKEAEETISVAESASSGALQLLFSSEEEAGLFFEGGITIYNCGQKERQLNIPKSICEPCYGVSTEVSEKLAKNVCELFGSDWGLSLTGFASPFPEAGIFDLYAYGAAARQGKLLFCEKLVSNRESPEEIREDYACMLIKKFAQYLEKEKNNLLK